MTCTARTFNGRSDPALKSGYRPRFVAEWTPDDVYRHSLWGRGFECKCGTVHMSRGSRSHFQCRFAVTIAETISRRIAIQVSQEDDIVSNTSASITKCAGRYVDS
jgi:hypothetical protein